MPLVDVANGRLVPLAGSGGWLVRVPHAVAYVAGSGEREVRELLNACEGASSSAEVLGRVVGRLSGAPDRSWPPFGLVTSTEDGVVVLVHGSARVGVTGEDGREALLSAEGGGSWMTRTVPGASRVSFGEVPGVVELNGLTDFRGGVTPAQGAVLLAADTSAAPAARAAPVPAAAAAAAAPAAPAAPAPRPAEPVAAAPAPVRPAGVAAVAEAPAAATSGRPDVAMAPEPAPPLIADEPTGQEAPVPEPAPATGGEEGVRVTGRYCGRGHFNAPRDHWCRICGLALSDDPSDEVEGARPPLGQLIWDNGEADLITTDTVVGRDPSSDAAVTAGHAVGLCPSGQSEGMSRVHAELRLVGWEVLLSDRASTNGTFLWDEAQQAWQRLEAGERHPLSIGAIVAFGERTATLESPMASDT